MPKEDQADDLAIGSDFPESGLPRFKGRGHGSLLSDHQNFMVTKPCGWDMLRSS